MNIANRSLMILSALALAAGSATASPAAQTCCAVVELRQYEMKPGQRDVLIDLFDKNFIETQEAVGNTVIGQFRDLDHPDRFVWLRGFPDMPARAKALDTFYTGATWRQHRDAANATMIDVSDVLLLRPLKPLPVGKRPGDESATGLVEIAVYPFDPKIDAEAIAQADRDFEAAGANAVATYVTESSPNNFPALPVRENENVLVRIATFSSVAAHDAHRAALARSPQWQALTQRLRAKLKSDPQILRLAPTKRSLTHG